MKTVVYSRYRYDTETGLYYLQSRYYNPEWGRFVNGDAIIGQTGELLSHNMFSYCLNNTIMYDDPSGFMPGLNPCLSPDGGSGAGVDITPVIGLLVEGINIVVSSIAIGALAVKDLVLPSSTTKGKGTAIESEKDITWENRRSASFYPVAFSERSFGLGDTLIIFFDLPMTQKEAEVFILGGGDVWTYDMGRAQAVAKAVNGVYYTVFNHKVAPDGSIRPGLYWDHYHGIPINSNVLTRKEYRNHIFFGLPK